MRARTRISALVMAVATASALTACSQSDEGPKQNVPTVTPASAAVSPTGGPAPTGSVLASEPGAVVVAARGAGAPAAVLAAGGESVEVFTAPGAADTPAPLTVKVPAIRALTASGDGFLGAGDGGLVRIDPRGTVTEQHADLGGAESVAVANDGRILVGTSRGHLLVLDKEGRIQRDIGGFVGVDHITVAPASAGEMAGQVVVLDRAQSAVTPVDIDSGELKAALRAGDGATTSTVDDYGRVFVAGTRNNEVYAFYGQPIMMRLRAPVADSPYALAFDNQRKLLWVSSTATNEITAYALGTGEAVEKHRITSVAQVSSMDVDPSTGALLVLSGRDGALQVVLPSAVK